MYARALTWWTVLRVCLEERLVYRADFALGTLLRFMPIVTQIFLWGAIFSAASGATISGYDFGDMVAYFLLAMLARAFSSMPGLSSGIALEIRDGTIKKYLIQPIDMISFLLLRRIAHKLVYYGVAAGPFALVFFLCRGYFSGWPEAEVIVAFIVSLLLTFALGFFLEATIGMVGFWLLEVSSLLFIYQLLTFFASGHMFPLDLLPGTFATIVKALPFQYLAFFPAAVFLGKIPREELLSGLMIQAAWVLFFIGTCRLGLALGLRRYSGFGG